jgi:hypothetical protein
MFHPPSRHPPGLSVVNGVEPVPVYDCHVILSGPDAAGLLHGRVTNLPGLTASARTERDLLRKLVTDFKAALISYREQGQPVPWIEGRAIPQPGESQRWIPVHL